LSDTVVFQSTTIASPPDATIVATDDAGAAGQVQIMKLAIATNGSATPIPADADGLLVNLGSNNDVTVSGVSTAANQSTVIGHLDGVETLLGTIDADTSTLAGAVSGTEMQVDVLTSALPTANTTSAVTSVADTASSTTLLSAAATRKGFRITNSSSAVLYVKYGTTASASDFSVRLPQWAYLEENFYSGRVDGIWASDPGDGAALITSLSA